MENVLETELALATPTIQKFVDAMQSKPHVQITNIKGSFSGVIARDHVAGAAVDISKASLPDPIAAKIEFEKYDLICQSHYNSSWKIAPDDNLNSHFHCTDKWWKKRR